MELTADNVEAVVKDCLFNEDEDTSALVRGDTVQGIFGFHPERLESHREEVKSMLEQLHDNFRASKGGGWSFLNMCERADGVHWGKHRSCALLIALGDALKLTSFPMPRELWPVLPGGVPYVIYNDKENSPTTQG